MPADRVQESAPPRPAHRSFERRRFTASDVRRMVEAGVLHESDPLELIDGELIVVNPQGPRHAALKEDLRDRLAEAYSDRPLHVRDQVPIAVAPDGEPEPDLCVTRGAARDYLDRHPGGADVVLAVEIAVSSLALDEAKASVYARAGVPVYWLLDLGGRRLVVHAHPSRDDGSYRLVTILAESEEVDLPESNVSWRVGDLLA